MSREDRVYLTSFYDDSVPLPEGAERELTERNPRLRELRQAYAALDLPVTSGSRWRPEAVDEFLDLRYFRGESLFYWHYRELKRVTELKFFVLLQYVRERDARGLITELGEDGAFGCWTFDYPGYGRVSRDLLESVNEIGFLDRATGLGKREGAAVLDIGAGYGRLAHRMAQAFSVLADYCCVDAVPESTFICEYYLRHRGVTPPTRVVPMHELGESLRPGSFDLAVNVHSFSEIPLAAIRWWVDELVRLEVPELFLVPNDAERLLTTEADDSRLDFAPVLEEAGFRLSHREPVCDDPAVRTLLELEDRFHLYSREC